MKKIIGLVVVLLLAITLIGCSGSADDHTITFAWWGTASRNTATYAAIAKFEEKYPQYTVEGDQYAWSGYQETLGNQLNRGSEADVFQVNYNWIYSMYGEDYFLDLNELDLDFSVYPADEHDPLTVNNKILALSVSETGYVFYFNETLYESVDVDIPTTWNELIAAGQTINGNDSNQFALGRVDAQAASMLLFTYLSQKYQRNVINENNELAFSETELVEGFYFLDDLINNGVINTNDTSPDGPSNPKWTSGNYGAVMTWNTAIAEYQDSLSSGNELVTGGMLQQNTGEKLGMYKKISMAYAVSQRVGQSSAKKEAVKTFLEFMTTDPEAVEILGVDRGVSSILSVQNVLENSTSNFTDTLEWQGHFIVQELYDYELSLGVDLYIHPYYEHATFRKFYENIIESFLTAGKTPAAAAAQIAAGFNTYLQTYMEG